MGTATVTASPPRNRPSHGFSPVLALPVGSAGFRLLAGLLRLLW